MQYKCACNPENASRDLTCNETMNLIDQTPASLFNDFVQKYLVLYEKVHQQVRSLVIVCSKQKILPNPLPPIKPSNNNNRIAHFDHQNRRSRVGKVRPAEVFGPTRRPNYKVCFAFISFILLILLKYYLSTTSQHQNSAVRALVTQNKKITNNETDETDGVQRAAVAFKGKAGGNMSRIMTNRFVSTSPPLVGVVIVQRKCVIAGGRTHSPRKQSNVTVQWFSSYLSSFSAVSTEQFNMVGAFQVLKILVDNTVYFH